MGGAVARGHPKPQHSPEATERTAITSATIPASARAECEGSAVTIANSEAAGKDESAQRATVGLIIAARRNRLRNTHTHTIYGADARVWPAESVRTLSAHRFGGRARPRRRLQVMQEHFDGTKAGRGSKSPGETSSAQWRHTSPRSIGESPNPQAPTPDARPVAGRGTPVESRER